jgi:hypothetical protein
MQRPVSRYGVLVLALVPTFAFLGGSAAGATRPSLTVKAPASVINEAKWSVTVSGFSGPYKNVMVSKEKGEIACPKPEAAFNKRSQVIAKQHKFNVTFPEEQITDSPPQTFTLCAYLYSGSKYIVKVSHYQIVPNQSESTPES